MELTNVQDIYVFVREEMAFQVNHAQGSYQCCRVATIKILWEYRLHTDYTQTIDYV